MMKQGKSWQFIAGFSLIELLTVIAVLGILAAVAIQSMNGYILRARYSDLVNASTPFRKGVDLCYQLTSSLNNCTSGQNGVPTDITTPVGSVAFIFTLSGGQIYVFPNTANGFNLLNDYYILTPRISNQRLIWTFSGPGSHYI
ncbi:MAG: prepilin-type N-terminal cleavage/methylation domain-containing protein [Gammaproteobacteria bacterium]